MKFLKKNDGSWDWTLIVMHLCFLSMGATLIWCFIGALIAGNSADG